MKLFVVLNENKPGAHDDVHQALTSFKESGDIDSYFCYPHVYNRILGKSNKTINDEIAEVGTSSKFDAVLWMHTGDLPIYENTITKIKGSNVNLVMGYWDGDLYQSPYRPVPKEMIQLVSRCNVTFAQGFGEMTNLFAKAGQKDIRFVPAYGDQHKFKFIPKNEENVLHDIVMIGNNITSRNPFRRTMKGTKLRKSVFNELTKKYHKNFAIYGNGWNGISAKGPLPYKDQANVYQKSRISVSVNNYSGKYYFSDRLPISLLSGIPVIHNQEEGLQDVFKEFEGIRYFNHKDELIMHIEEYLNLSIKDLNALGEKIYRYALQHFTAERAFKYKIDVLKEIRYNLGKTKNHWIEF